MGLIRMHKDPEGTWQLEGEFLARLAENVETTFRNSRTKSH